MSVNPPMLKSEEGSAGDDTEVVLTVLALGVTVSWEISDDTGVG